MAIDEACRIARIEAENETGFIEVMVPAMCPWTDEQIKDDAFWPGLPSDS